MTHGHDHGTAATGQRLVLSIFITVAFVIGEAIAGYFAHSLALLSDAGHNFADALALVLSWYGIWIARKPSTQQRTFGYHRVGIFAALVNAVSLVVIALLIFWEATDRLGHPQPVHSMPMIAVALIVLVFAPYWGGRQTLRLLAEMFTFAALASLWNLLAGYAGLVSVGQQAFVGLGGYLLFALAILLGIHPIAAILIAGPIGAVIAIPVGWRKSSIMRLSRQRPWRARPKPGLSMRWCAGSPRRWRRPLPR